MQKIYEKVKLDIGLKPQTLSNTNITGSYFDMSGYHGATFFLSGAAMATTKATTFELLQATDAEGSGSKGIPTDIGQTAVAVVTANVKVEAVTVALASVGAGDTVTINGVTFTKAGATSAADREFADAAGLVICAMDLDYGVEGVTATDNTTTVTVTATDPGERTVTVSRTDVGGTVVLATTQYGAYIEVDNLSLDHDDGYTHIACKVTTTATSGSVVSVALLRGPGREIISQAVGASASV